MEKLIVILFLFISYFLQTSVDILRIGNIKPDFLLIFTIFFAANKGPFVGLWIGFFGGLLQDINIGGISTDVYSINYFIGVHALPKTIVGYVVGKIADGIRKDNLFVLGVVVFFSSLFVGLFTFVLISLFHNAIAAQAFFSVVLPETLYNTFLGVVWILVLRLALPTIWNQKE